MTLPKNSIQKEITQRLTFIINKKVESKKQLAKTLNVAPTTVSAWTSGRILPSIPILIKIAVVTHTSLDWLLLGKQNITLDKSFREEIFNQVFEEGYKFAKRYKIPINGSFFLGLYYLVSQEIDKDPSITPRDIIINNTRMIINLSQTSV